MTLLVRAGSRARPIILAVVTIPVLFAAMVPLSQRIEARIAELEPGKDVLNVASPKLIRQMSLGYHGLMADIYWTRVVQYYGGKRRDQDANFPLLEPLLDITVTLDPHFLAAYKFGAMFLAEPPPKGAGRPEAAVKLIRRAIDANPGDWRLWHDLGFIYYWDLKDYQKASEAYAEGARNPRARDWMKVMAARIAQEGGTRQTSQFLWLQVRDSTSDPSIRKNAEGHLMGLKAEEDAERLKPLVDEFHRRTGRWPSATSELVAAGLLRRVPADPAGFPYGVDQEGKITLHAKSPVSSPLLPKPGAPTWALPGK